MDKSLYDLAAPALATQAEMEARRERNKRDGYIAVDFDGTLATYTTWQGAAHCGEPIAPMVERVKGWLARGIRVKVYTARAHDCYDECAPAIRAWTLKHIGQELEVTCQKTAGMIELWDDRAFHVIPGTGVAAHELAWEYEKIIIASVAAARISGFHGIANSMEEAFESVRSLAKVG